MICVSSRLFSSSLTFCILSFHLGFSVFCPFLLFVLLPSSVGLIMPPLVLALHFLFRLSCFIQTVVSKHQRPCNLTWTALRHTQTDYSLKMMERKKKILEYFYLKSSNSMQTSEIQSWFFSIYGTRTAEWELLQCGSCFVWAQFTYFCLFGCLVGFFFVLLLVCSVSNRKWRLLLFHLHSNIPELRNASFHTFCWRKLSLKQHARLLTCIQTVMNHSWGRAFISYVDKLITHAGYKHAHTHTHMQWRTQQVASGLPQCGGRW